MIIKGTAKLNLIKGKININYNALYKAKTSLYKSKIILPVIIQDGETIDIGNSGVFTDITIKRFKCGYFI